jgi:hypothetical protein
VIGAPLVFSSVSPNSVLVLRSYVQSVVIRGFIQCLQTNIWT